MNFAERVQERVLVSYDPNVRASMIPDRAKFRNSFEAMCARCAIVKASDADLAWIYDSPFDRGIVAHILNCGAKLVLVTQGSQGVWRRPGMLLLPRKLYRYEWWIRLVRETLFTRRC